jgi:hypothetical protein
MHQHVDIGFGVVMNAVGAEGGGIAEMVAQQVRVTQQLLQMLTHFLDAFGAWFTLEATAGISDEVL